MVEPLAMGARGWSEPARDRLAIAGAALAALAVYALTACRTVYVGDSGELAAVCATFGIAHPSGYPLYTLLGGTFTHCWPVAARAFAANLFSGLCGAAAVGFLAALVLDWVAPGPGRRPAAAAATLTLAFATAFWQESTVARVYTLNAAASIAVLWCAGRWAARGTAGWAVATGAVTGLALANHLAAVGAVVAAGVLVLPGRWAGSAGATWAREWPRFVVALLVFPAGPLLYAWLPIRFAHDPAVRWDDIDSLGALVGYVLRRNYADRSWTDGDPLRMAQALLHGVWVVAWDLKLVGLALAAWGFATLRGQRARWVALLAFAFVFGVLFVMHGQRRDLFLWDRYWLTWHVIAALGAGLGLAPLLARLPAPPARLAAALVLPAVLLAGHWSICDRSAATRAADHAHKLLERLPEGARVIAQDDNVMFPLLYSVAAEGRRPDCEWVWSGMRPIGQTMVDPVAVRTGRQTLVWTLAPDFPPGQRFVEDAVGLLNVARLGEMPPAPPAAWDDWAIPSFEDAPPAAAIEDSHDRELLAHYFIQKARALDRTDPVAADAALARARDYAAGDELSLRYLYLAAVRLRRGALKDECVRLVDQLDRRWARDLRSPLEGG